MINNSLKLSNVKSVSFTGTRYYDPTLETNKNKMIAVASVVMKTKGIEYVNFGCAQGVDTEMLYYCGSFRNAFKDECNDAKLVAYVPDRLSVINNERSIWAVKTFADKTVELKNKITEENGWKSYHIRNQTLVDNCDILIAMPLEKMNPRSGTRSTMNKGWSQGKQVVVINLI